MPKDVAYDDTVEVNVDRHWYGLVIGLLFSGGVLFAIASVAWLVIKSILNPDGNVKLSVPPKPKTLLEAQAQYEKLNSKKAMRLVPFLPMVFIGTIVLFRSGIEDASKWLPGGSTEVLPWLMVPIGILALISAIVRRKRRGSAEPTPAEKAMRPLRYAMIPLLFMVVFMMVQLQAPNLLYRFPPEVIRWLIICIIPSPLIILLLTSFKKGKKTTEKLGPGDIDYDAAAELAKRAQLKMRRLIVLKESEVTNAYARIDGTVVLTKGARDSLTDQDRRCVIAHELGHLKGRHVPFLMVISFIFWGVLIGAEIWIRNSKLPPAIVDGSWILTSPVLFLPLLLVIRSPFQRKAEFAADKFALEAIGNFTDVAVALAKVHLYNASPHTFTKFHEPIASHPSLVKRLNALRDVALQMGMDVPVDAVQSIIESVTIEEPDATKQAVESNGPGDETP